MKVYYRITKDSTKTPTIQVGDIGELLEKDDDLYLLYNKKWIGHSGLDAEYRESKYQSHLWWFNENEIEKI